MGYIFSILSQLFFVTALIPIIWGIYIIRLNPRQSLNQVFLLLCIALGVWAFGFSMANSSSSLEHALLWRRFASIGMTFLFSTILHFLILLTQGEERINNKKMLLLIYLPAFIAMYAFTISPNSTAVLYDLIQTDYGLINVANNSFWNYFYYTYYLLYMILSLVLIWHWKKKIDNKVNRRQANLIFGAILLTAVLGSLTDILANTFLSGPIPQIAPLFILLAVWAIYHSMRHFDLINYGTIVREDLIITEIERDKMFYTIAIVFIVGGLFSFVLEYSLSLKNSAHNLNLGVFKSLTVFFIGMILFFVQKIQHTRLKEGLTIVTLVASIPLITISFTEYFAVTVWAYPLVLITTSLVLNKKTLLIATTIVSIVTQRIIWVANPEGMVYMDEYAYIFRIIFIFTAFLVGYYVNEMYLANIEENEFQIKFQKLNAELSSELVTMNKENEDEKIATLLADLGQFFGADRTYLFLIDYEKGIMSYFHEWCAEGVPSEVRRLDNAPITDYSWWLGQLNKEKLIHITDINDIPKEAVNEQKQLVRQGIKTTLSVPVEGKNEMQGFIGIDSVKAHKTWTDQDINLLSILSNLLSDGLMRVKSERKIEYMAYYDALTDLPNRFLFEYRANQAIKYAKRTDSLFSIMFIDLDNFKTVNDTLGHDGGDQLLEEIASQLKRRVRGIDTVGRFGGDEFLVLVKDIENKDELKQIADHLMTAFTKPFNISGEEFFVTGSAGIAMYPLDGENPETLIKNADTAMYAAKDKGKNQYAFCTSDMKEKVDKNIKITNDLYYALEREELMVYYQPQLDIDNTEITGLEALLRWNHPELGMIPPSIFIPIAEESGLINSIGEWVLREACIQNKSWQNMGLAHLKMAVNLSGIQLINANIVDQVARILTETELDPEYLELEITESIAINETDLVVNVLEELKTLGVSLAIDDFGTEYSSLSRLKLLPIDRIKIDMAFIHAIETSDKDKAITVVIINLAKSLGLNVLAEGVETAPQLEFLNQKMCDHAQGYYYYKPMSAKEIEKTLRKQLGS